MVTRQREREVAGLRRKAGTAAFRVLLVLLATSSAGCSLVFSRVPSDEDAAYFGCPTRIPPVLDTIVGSMVGGGAIVAMNTIEKGQQEVSYSSVVAGGLVALTYFASAVYGFRNASVCADASEAPAPAPPSSAPKSRLPGPARTAPEGTPTADQDDPFSVR